MHKLDYIIEDIRQLYLIMSFRIHKVLTTISAEGIGSGRGAARHNVTTSLARRVRNSFVRKGKRRCAIRGSR